MPLLVLSRSCVEPVSERLIEFFCQDFERSRRSGYSRVTKLAGTDLQLAIPAPGRCTHSHPADSPRSSCHDGRLHPVCPPCGAALPGPVRYLRLRRHALRRGALDDALALCKLQRPSLPRAAILRSGVRRGGGQGGACGGGLAGCLLRWHQLHGHANLRPDRARQPPQPRAVGWRQQALGEGRQRRAPQAVRRRPHGVRRLL